MTFQVRRALYGRHRQRRADSAQRGQAQDLQPDRDTCGGVLERMARTQTLWAAWARVAAGSGMPGADGITVQDFAARLGPRLDRLAEQLAARQYEPQPLRLAAIHRGGRRRRLDLPTVRDRIAQRAFLDVCHDHLDAAEAEAVTSAPLGRISEVVVFGNVGLTTPALNALLAEDVPLVLLSVDGRPRGRLEPPRSSAVDARRHQFNAYLDPVARLAHARAIARGKIHNRSLPLPGTVG